MSSWIKLIIAELQDHIGSNWIEIGRDIMQTDAMTQAIISHQERLSCDPYGMHRKRVGITRTKYHRYAFKIENIIKEKKGKCRSIRISDTVHSITAYLSNSALNSLKTQDNIAVDISSLHEMYFHLRKGYFMVNTSKDRKISLYIQRMSYVGETPNKKTWNYNTKDVNLDKEIESIRERIEECTEIYKNCMQLPDVPYEVTDFSCLPHNFTESPEDLKKTHSQVYISNGSIISKKTIQTGVLDQEVEHSSDSASSHTIECAKENSDESSSESFRRSQSKKDKTASQIKYVATIPQISHRPKSAQKSTTHPHVNDKLEAPGKKSSNNLDRKINKEAIRSTPEHPLPQKKNHTPPDDTLNSIEITPSVIKDIIRENKDAPSSSNLCEGADVLAKGEVKVDKSSLVYTSLVDTSLVQGNLAEGCLADEDLIKNLFKEDLLKADIQDKSSQDKIDLLKADIQDKSSQDKIDLVKNLFKEDLDKNPSSMHTQPKNSPSMHSTKASNLKNSHPKTSQDKNDQNKSIENNPEWSPVEELSDSQVTEMINETLSRFPAVISISEYKKIQGNK
ncbi:hypothetical protein NERG_00475 [Nematocida ausubeli]|uniref:Uncharacterized protein n=1 Tax=Nematocida ausubeli (strain ATCC PRA-371 / ERTm2) TaxID=1913371 RepID=H8ZA54_NEMA1|nr:hypothetical protein NERG_00475 [Nematocida ausubeli]